MHKTMKSFLTALKFLTIIPLPGGDENFEKSISFFPVVGLFLGLILAGINLMLSGFLPELALKIVIIVALTLLTGALHLDGVADTFDALAASGNREHKLKIMRNSHVGAVGATGVTCILLLKLAGLSSIPSESLPTALILMPVLGRWALAAACTFSSYAREEGKALVFMKGNNLYSFVLASVFTFAVSLVLLRWERILTLAFIAVSTFLLIKFFTRIFGGLSGDTLGTVNESIEVLFVFFIVILL